MPTLTERSHELSAAYDLTVEAVRNDTMLSEEGKRLAIAQAWVRMTDGINEARERDTASVDTERKRLEEKYLSLPRPTLAESSAERTARATSYRDAIARAADTETSDGLAQVLNRAVRSGDDLLARAALAIAFERDDLQVINRYADLHPGTEPDLQRLVDLTGPAQLRDRMRMEMALSSRAKPAELGFLADDQIRELAGS